MSAKRSGYLALPVILAALAVLTGWACLPSRGQAGADGFTAFSSRPTHSALVSAQPHAPDERWRELVRQGRTHANRSPDAGFTININLTTSDLAGTAPSPLPVSAWVLRDGYPVAAGQSDPFPDPGGNFYQVDLVWEGYPCFGSCGFNYFIPGDQVWVSQAGTPLASAW